MIALQTEDSLLLLFCRTVFVKWLRVVCQEAEVNSSSNEMDEVLRAVSAENERLLSATHSSQRHRQSSVSILYILHISCPTYKPTPIPAAENVAKISDPRISQ